MSQLLNFNKSTVWMELDFQTYLSLVIIGELWGKAIYKNHRVQVSLQCKQKKLMLVKVWDYQWVHKLHLNINKVQYAWSWPECRL